MTSLSEVYEGGSGGADLRRLYLGVGLFVVGAVLTVAGIVIGATPSLSLLFGGEYAAREVAAVLGGVGLPLGFLGVVTILPQTSRTLRGVAVGGAVISVAAVVAFVRVYPYDWTTGDPAYALPVVVAYALGALVSFWCVFTAVANFKTRNDPGGTVELEITKGGETRVVEVSNENLRQSLGGIGLLGSTPDGNAETQTNRRATTDGGAAATTVSAGGSTPTDDGGEVVDDGAVAPTGDTYCGNCDHFRYVRTEQGMQPYCGHHDVVMDDMDPCEAWTPNTDR